MTQKDFEKEIVKITKIIADKYQPEKIILYGSAARGDFGENSDIDMLIIKKSKKRRFERAADVFGLIAGIGRRIPFEPLVLTPSEVEKMENLGDPFLGIILKEGKVLYGSENSSLPRLV